MPPGVSLQGAAPPAAHFDAGGYNNSFYAWKSGAYDGGYWNGMLECMGSSIKFLKLQPCGIGITRQVNSCAIFFCCAANWCTLLPSLTHPGPVCPLCSPGGRNRGYCNDAIKGGYADDSCNPHDVYYNELGGLDDTPISWSSPVSVDPSSTDDWLSSVGAYEGGEGRESKSERKREGEREISVARSALDIFQV